MSWLNFLDPGFGIVAGSGGNSNVSHAKPPTPNTTPLTTHLPYPTANPDWNLATVKPISPSMHGWSANSLQSYLTAFQRGGPAAGAQYATDQQLFPQVPSSALSLKDSLKDPEKLAKTLMDQNSQPANPGVVPALISTSTGGELSPGAAALFGRMLGGVPPASMPSQNVPVSAKPVIPPLSPLNQARHHGTLQGNEGDSGRRAGTYSRGRNATPSAWSIGDSSLYAGMTDLQRQQALQRYNQTQAPPKTLG